MDKEIIYDYVDKEQLQSDWLMEVVDKLYSIARPVTTESFKDLCKKHNEMSKDKYSYPTDFYYVPQEVAKTIVNDFLEKHNIAFHWKDDMEFLIEVLFEKGGLKEVYGPTDWSKEPLRHCEDVPTLDKIIPKEYSDKVKEVLEGYANTYKFGRNDYNSMHFSIFNYAPCTSRDMVIKAWKELGKDVEIPEDNCWKDVYEITEEED